jgi:hypothetical protein
MYLSTAGLSKAVIRPPATYGVESWALTNNGNTLNDMGQEHIEKNTCKWFLVNKN